MTTSVFVNDVRVPERHRSLDPDTVKSIAGSFKDIGQQTPITFYWDSATIADTPVLIAGRHRLEAARSLGWEHIDAVEMDTDDLTQEFWEIDENLMRADLTAIERAEHTARRADIVEKRAESLIPQNEEKPAHRPSRGQGDFVKDTAAKTGKSKASVERDKRRGKKITPETMKAIKDTPAADKGVELDGLASLKPEEQAQAVERVKSGASKDFREAKDFIKGEPLDLSPCPKEGHPLKIPDGKTVEQACRDGMAMEGTGMKATAAAKAIGMSAKSYRLARYIVYLADRTDLSLRDKKTAEEALLYMNKHRQVIPAYEYASVIIERIWGKPNKRVGLQDERNRIKRFDLAYGMIIQAYILSADVDVPHLSAQRTAEILAELKEGKQCLRKFEQKISEIHQ